MNYFLKEFVVAEVAISLNLWDIMCSSFEGSSSVFILCHSSSPTQGILHILIHHLFPITYQNDASKQQVVLGGGELHSAEDRGGVDGAGDVLGQRVARIREQAVPDVHL